jgi:YfiH family protein
MPIPQVVPKIIDTPLTVAENGVALIPVPAWSGFNWLWHGFSTHRSGVSCAYLPEELAGRAGLTRNSARDSAKDSGQLNLGFTPTDTAENVRENRLRWVDAVTGSRATPLVVVRQIHSNRSLVAPRDWAGVEDGSAPEADGIITNERGFLIGIQTADCIPVLVADTKRRAVAAFHAGWRGTVARIVELGVARMREEFGSEPADLVAAIGPGIGACCYTVGAEVLAKFSAGFSYADELFPSGEDAVRLDLTEANRRQLMSAGIPESSIAVVGGCTGCQPELFYSHRASGGHAGRMMAVIGIR